MSLPGAVDCVAAAAAAVAVARAVASVVVASADWSEPPVLRQGEQPSSENLSLFNNRSKESTTRCIVVGCSGCMQKRVRGIPDIYGSEALCTLETDTVVSCAAASKGCPI